MQLASPDRGPHALNRHPFGNALEPTLVYRTVILLLEDRPMAADSDSINRALLRNQLEEIVIDFAYRVDRGDAESAADLFTPDGEYIWEGHGHSVGRDAIRLTYRNRALLGPRTARHLFTNLRLQEVMQQRALTTAIMLLFAENGTPPQAAIPLLVADVDDEFVLHEGRWLLKVRRLKDIFVDSERTPVLPLSGPLSP